MLSHGCPGGTRTHTLEDSLSNCWLYQFAYRATKNMKYTNIPITVKFSKISFILVYLSILVGSAGFDPAALCSQSKRSPRLSYEPYFTLDTVQLLSQFLLLLFLWHPLTFSLDPWLPFLGFPYLSNPECDTTYYHPLALFWRYKHLFLKSYWVPKKLL